MPRNPLARPWRAASLLFAFAAAIALPAAAATAAAPEWKCPDGFAPREGLNLDFPADGRKRAFIVIPPAKSDAPLPVWVPLTGTVEATAWNLYVPRSGSNAKLAQAGFMVIAPVRDCTDQNPDLGSGPCNNVGKNGWNWNPWNDGRAADASGDRWKQDEGPDSRFLKAIVQCVGTKWKLDPARLFIGGISAGGTMTNRALLFGFDFWAGGLPISGEWYVTKDDGTPLSFADARNYVAANPKKIFQGRVGPLPLPAKTGPMVVMTVWGGEKDLWNCGAVLCADYRPSTQAGANYFAAQPDVVHIACTATHGHMWPQVNTDAFNRWALQTLASHPKGAPVSAFKLTPPPEGYSCKVGTFTDHY